MNFGRMYRMLYVIYYEKYKHIWVLYTFVWFIDISNEKEFAELFILKVNGPTNNYVGNFKI